LTFRLFCATVYYYSLYFGKFSVVKTNIYGEVAARIKVTDPPFVDETRVSLLFYYVRNS
jgi:hypothetical protein